MKYHHKNCFYVVILRKFLINPPHPKPHHQHATTTRTFLIDASIVFVISIKIKYNFIKIINNIKCHCIKKLRNNK